jgi:hypothetical protein
MRNIAIAGLCATLFCCRGFSQGQYLPYRQSGVGVAGSWGFLNLGTSIGAGLTYSFLGVVDYTFEYAHVKAESSSDVKLRGNDFGGGLTVHILKQSPRIPFALAVSGAYFRGIYSVRKDGSIHDAEADAFGFGGTLYKSITLTDRWAAHVAGGYRFSHVITELENRKHSEDVHTAIAALECIRDLGSTAKLVFGPSLGYTGDDIPVIYALALIFLLR